MNRRRRALGERQALLLARSGALRDRIALQAEAAWPVVSWVDRGARVALWLRRNPLAAASAAAALLILRRPLGRLAARGFWAWQLGRGIWPRLLPVLRSAISGWRAAARR